MEKKMPDLVAKITAIMENSTDQIMFKSGVITNDIRCVLDIEDVVQKMN